MFKNLILLLVACFCINQNTSPTPPPLVNPTSASYALFYGLGLLGISTSLIMPKTTKLLCIFPKEMLFKPLLELSTFLLPIAGTTVIACERLYQYNQHSELNLFLFYAAGCVSGLCVPFLCKNVLKNKFLNSIMP